MAIDLPTPYADESDLADYWRPLTEAEQDRVQVLLGWAAKRINDLPGSDAFDPVTCAGVSLDMVKRAMIGGGGETVEAQAMAGMSVNRTFANPMGDLYLTAKEIDRLQGYTGPAAFSVAMSSNVRTPPECWNTQPAPCTNDSHGSA